MKLITSSHTGQHRKSWSQYDVLNIVNRGEIGDYHVAESVPRLFPGRFGPAQWRL
jgi:hypothetical protein